MAPHDSPPAAAIELPLPRRPGQRAGSPRAHRPPAIIPPPAVRVPLSHAQLSELLWTAFGLSRRGSHGRGPLPLHDGSGLELFVCLPEGCYRYEPHDHALLPVAQRDARALATGPGSRSAPALALVYVTDGGVNDDWEDTGILAGEDVPAIAGHVAAWCAAAGLAADSRPSFDPELPRLLGVRPPRGIALTQLVLAAPHGH